jgi:hypothetical protein
MRKALLVLLPVAILVLIAFAIQAQDAAAPTKWLDMQNCYFCQPLTQTEGLMDHLTWENHKIKNGIVAVTTYPPEWKEKHDLAVAEMQKRWQAYDPAKPQPMCGMCEAWTKMPMDKLDMETVWFKGGEIGLTTSTDSAVVVRLHEIADKTCAAMDEMMKAVPPK